MMENEVFQRFAGTSNLDDPESSFRLDTVFPPMAFTGSFLLKDIQENPNLLLW